MSRYIDADALKDKLQQHHDFWVMAWGGFSKMPISDKKRVDEITNCIAEVVNAPSIDIVRCRECEHGTWNEQAEMYICSANDQDLYEAGHFCSYGERREP